MNKLVDITAQQVEESIERFDSELQHAQDKVVMSLVEDCMIKLDQHLNVKPDTSPYSRNAPCGELFCGRCGDCIHCYGGDACVLTEDGKHIIDWNSLNNAN